MAREAARRGEPKARVVPDSLRGVVGRRGTEDEGLEELIGMSDSAPIVGETIDDVVYA